MSLTKATAWLMVAIVLAIATAGTIAGGITGRQLVAGKAGDVIGSGIDIFVAVIDGIQEGLSKLGDDEPAAPAPGQPGA